MAKQRKRGVGLERRGAVRPRDPRAGGQSELVASRDETGPMLPPAQGSPVRELSFAARLRDLANLELEEPQAEELWRSVARHRRELLRLLTRDVGQRVALLDYVTNIRPQVVEPTIIETTALEAIKRDATSDSLTGLFNRHFFDSALKREVERCLRYGVSSSLLLLDLDEFKEINDEYGHRVGDKVLQALGSLIVKHLRAADVPCRYGGDEFAIILTDTAQPDAIMVAERIRADVEASFEKRPLCGQFLDVSVSGGLATLPLDASSAEQLFIMADGALYEAKNAGANRIATAPSLPPAPPPEAA